MKTFSGFLSPSLHAHTKNKSHLNMKKKKSFQGHFQLSIFCGALTSKLRVKSSGAYNPNNKQHACGQANKHHTTWVCNTWAEAPSQIPPRCISLGTLVLPQGQQTHPSHRCNSTRSRTSHSPTPTSYPFHWLSQVPGCCSAGMLELFLDATVRSRQLSI